ncbi:9442_t:CDS:2 [Acaulospora morrowiae]|uniref:9442_t:CDS:1 n=1 Tax=Acaulospora morrowiae TaxID=94023 RepID=A0A9N8YRM3_9GLOM|nr:9442_t:CDS:2 [Acaulospora morrowiae]
MKIIGLTGGISSGKSTVSRMFIRRKIPVIDGDLLARQVVEPGRPAFKLIVKHFTPEILQEDGTLNREKLGNIIFSDEKQRKILNKCTHPFIRTEILKLLIWYWIKGERIIVLDAPLLIESGLNRYIRTVLVVYCPERLQLTRLVERDKISESAARQRISSQMPLKEKVKHANYVIDNSADIKTTEEQVDKIVAKINPSMWSYLLWWLGPPSLVIAGILAIAT